MLASWKYKISLHTFWEKNRGFQINCFSLLGPLLLWLIMSGIYQKRQANKKSLQATLRKRPNSSGHFSILLYTTNHWLSKWSHQGTNNVDVFNGCLFRPNNYSLKSSCLCIVSVKIKTCILFPQGICLWDFFYRGMHNTESWSTKRTYDQDICFRIANVDKRQKSVFWCHKGHEAAQNNIHTQWMTKICKPDENNNFY